MTCGVYQIIYVPTGERYIGSSVDIRRRSGEHMRELAGGIHSNNRLQRRYNGDLGAFIFTTLWEAPDGTAPERLIKAEAWFIARKQPELNIVLRPDLPAEVSQEVRDKLAASGRRRKHSAATRRKIGLASRGNTHNRGRVHGPEMRQKMSEALKGNSNHAGFRHSDEAKRKMREAWERRRAKGAL